MSKLEDLRKRRKELEAAMHNNSMRNRAYRREHGEFSDEILNEGRRLADEMREASLAIHRVQPLNLGLLKK